MGSLAGQIAVITGAGRGIGAACARLLASEGARVILVSRTLSELDAVARQINSGTAPHSLDLSSSTPVAWPFRCDVSDSASVRALFDFAEKTAGRPTILINNAAVVTVAGFMDTPEDVWDQTMAVNLRGPFLCSKEFFQRTARGEKKPSAIVNLSSLGGLRGTEKFKGMSSYVVSKFGMVGLTESLAVEGRELGIRVNCVAPGAVDTEMLRKAAPFLKTETTPDDVAKVIFFLADSNQSGAVTGTVLEIFSNA